MQMVGEIQAYRCVCERESDNAKLLRRAGERMR